MFQRPRSNDVSRNLAIVLVVTLTSCAFGQPPSPPPPPPISSAIPRRCRVHVDHVAKTRVADFERARHELLAAFEAKGVAEGTTFVLETDEPAFLSLRPFDRYGELDAAAARQKAIDDAVGEATLKKLDDITHATLVPPHHNEIWSLQSSLSYVPPGGTLTLATATGGRMVVHQVMPEKDEAYGEASERSVRALSDGHAHVARLTYVSAYGSGRYVTLWLGARSEDADAPLPETAAAEEGRARAASEDETVHRFVVRKDLASK